MKTTSPAALLLLSLWGCDPTGSGESPIEFQRIKAGVGTAGFCESSDREERVIKDKASLEKEYRKAVNDTSTLPNVDFTKEMAIMVRLNCRPTISYVAEIRSISATEDKLIVSYAEIIKGCAGGEITTTPYDIVSIGKTEKRIEFKKNLEADCK